MRAYEFKPSDALRLAARPAAGFGIDPLEPAAWPAPAILFRAWHAALQEAFPQVQLWEETHAAGTRGQHPQGSARTQRFGALTVAGPFPCRHEREEYHWLFPRPADVIGAGSEGLDLLAPIAGENARSNLPPPLRHLLAAPNRSGPPAGGDRKDPGDWWEREAIETYLRQERSSPAQWWRSVDLFETRWEWPAPPSTQSADAGAGRVHLRMNEDIAIVFLAALPAPHTPDLDAIALWRSSHGPWLSLGQRRNVGEVIPLPPFDLDAMLPVSAPVAGKRVKWLLLSPAVFPALAGRPDHPGGWLPSWVCPRTGQVLLRQGDTRRPGESRPAWRRRIRSLPGLDCRLVAARVPPPLVLDGWSARRHLRVMDPELQPGPRRRWLAVPAGSVYYFEGPDAARLADQLSWHGAREAPGRIRQIAHRQSALLGEQGFGLGACGPWDYADR